MINDGNFKFILMIFGIMLIGAGVSLLVTKLMKNKYAWNIPSIGGFVLITYLGCKIKYGNLEGFADLAYFILIMMVFAFIVGNSLTNLIIFHKRKTKELKIEIKGEN